MWMEMSVAIDCRWCTKTSYWRSGCREASAPRSVAPSGTAEPFGSACRTPATRALSAIAYDSATHNVVLFGGVGEDVYGDTWQWNGAGWQLAKTLTAPSPRSTVAAAFDDDHNLLVVYGRRGYGMAHGISSVLVRNLLHARPALSPMTPHPSASFCLAAEART